MKQPKTLDINYNTYLNFWDSFGSGVCVCVVGGGGEIALYPKVPKYWDNQK